MRPRIYLTALALFAALTAPAAAVTPAVQHALPRALAAAEAHWGAYPCKGHTAVAFVAADSIDAGEPATAGTGAVGEADPATCDVNIDADVSSPVDLCGELAHETRHLEGMWDPTAADPWHSPNPASIASAYYPGPTARCMRAFPPQQVKARRRAGWRCRADQEARGWICHKHGRYAVLDAATGHSE